MYCYSRSLIIGILTSFSSHYAPGLTPPCALFVYVYCKYKALIPLLRIGACVYVVWWSVATLTESLSVLICCWLFMCSVTFSSLNSLAWSSSLALLMHQSTMFRYWVPPHLPAVQQRCLPIYLQANYLLTLVLLSKVQLLRACHTTFLVHRFDMCTPWQLPACGWSCDHLMTCWTQ